MSVRESRVASTVCGHYSDFGQRERRTAAHQVDRDRKVARNCRQAWSLVHTYRFPECPETGSILLSGQRKRAFGLLELSPTGNS